MNKDVHVTVNCSKRAGGGFDFDMDVGAGKTHRIEFDKKKDGIKKNERYDVYFTLNNQDGAKLRFVRDEAIVMWTKAGEVGCPTHGEYQGDEFAVKRVRDADLWVENKNDTVSLYKFVLNFVDTETNALVPYDPIWDNRNGGDR